ncbi:MAG TPA: hypothetical protein DD490_28120, partial [Acidobacteria bacterium]|nr:hypothetical protein [Acidobacteriota bacterium]
SLFVTADPDGLRLGPLCVPGVSPCFGCAQLAALGGLGLSPRDTLTAAGAFHSAALEASAAARALEVLTSEIRAFLDPHGTPDLLFQILQILPSGAIRRLPVERRPDCPLCGGA